MNEETRYTVEYMDGETLMKANLTQAELADLLKVPGGVACKCKPIQKTGRAL